MSDINVNNDYTKMNNLTPFKLCVLQNFPFIESDFDAVTNYQLLCKVVEYLNNVIDNNNKQNANITQLEQNFIILYNYVKDYFDNLDVQEEINKKLDEMVSDGTIMRLFTSLVPYVYVEWFGAKGDGTTDDTNAFISALAASDYVLCNSKKYKIGNINLASNKHINFNNATITDTSDDLFNIISCQNVIVENCIIESEKSENTTHVFNVLNSESVTLRKITINGNYPYLPKTKLHFNILIENTKKVNISDITFNINQPEENDPVIYNHSDGVHVNGGCSDIEIYNVNGFMGDDIIALNSSEGHKRGIENVIIDSCTCGNENVYNTIGLRLLSFGTYIKNVNIINCKLYIKNTSCIRIANSEDEIGFRGSYANISNVNIINCELYNNKNKGIIVGGCELENVSFKNLIINTNSQEAINYVNNNKIDKHIIDNIAYNTPNLINMTNGVNTGVRKIDVQNIRHESDKFNYMFIFNNSIEELHFQNIRGILTGLFYNANTSSKCGNMIIEDVNTTSEKLTESIVQLNCTAENIIYNNVVTNKLIGFFNALNSITASNIISDNPVNINGTAFSRLNGTSLISDKYPTNPKSGDIFIKYQNGLCSLALYTGTEWNNI